MDCVIVSSRIAAYLDGELAPSEVEQFSMHIERCDACSQVVVRLEAQRFMPISSQDQEALCSRAGFWGEMDASLGAHMDEMVRVQAVVVGPWYGRKVGLPAPMLAAYAAAMLLVIAWGMQQRERALSAEVSADHLGQQLEQERRLTPDKLCKQAAFQ